MGDHPGFRPGFRPVEHLVHRPVVEVPGELQMEEGLVGLQKVVGLEEGRMGLQEVVVREDVQMVVVVVHQQLVVRLVCLVEVLLGLSPRERPPSSKLK